LPRDIALVTPVPVTVEPILRAAAAVDGDLAPRSLLAGSALQLVDLDDVAVLTLANSRRIDDAAEIARVVPGLPLPDGELWWTEAVAPWGPRGAAGAEIVAGLARALGGTYRIEDGT
jgi:hypothetical protein